MDIADTADEMTEFFLAQSLNKIKRESPPYSGKCLYCGESCGQSRYCDSGCREDHELQIKRLKRK